MSAPSIDVDFPLSFKLHANDPLFGRLSPLQSPASVPHWPSYIDGPEGSCIVLFSNGSGIHTIGQRFALRICRHISVLGLAGLFPLALRLLLFRSLTSIAFLD